MRFFLTYCKQQWKRILAFLLFCMVFLCSFFLYDVPAIAFLYPLAVCTILATLFFTYDMGKAWKKHNALQRISGLTAALMEHLPDIQTRDDEDYQAIIQALRRGQENLHMEMSQRYEDMVEYYTIWVHQIKTPIASMRLTLQNEDSELSRQLSEDLFRIEQYVEMVLVFLRLDSDSSDYLFKEQNLDEIVKGAVKKFSTQFIRRKIRLSYEPLNAQVLTDEKWLSFVVEQLLSNALKYTHSGGTITIELEEPMTLCIRDTGIGIAPEDLPRIFEKGYTGYNGRQDKKASGIGLYLCKCICDKLGHRLTANSSLDSGTVMRIHLEKQNLQVE